MGMALARSVTLVQVVVALVGSLALVSCERPVNGGQATEKAQGREFDAGWMTVRVPPGWEVESKLDGTGCPLAHVKVTHANGSEVTFLLDAFCGGEGNYGFWKIEWREDGRLVLIESPPPMDCGQGFEPPPCGAPSYWIDGLVTPGEGRGERHVGVTVGNSKRRQASDLPTLRAVVESARIKSEGLPPPLK